MKHTIILLLFLWVGFTGHAQAISLTNTYTPTAKKGYSSWTVFLKAPAATLASIDYIEYTLHPTFPKPVQQIRASKVNPNFSITAAGWGEFELKAKIVFKSSAQRPLYMNYQLDLHSPDKGTGSKGKTE